MSCLPLPWHHPRGRQCDHLYVLPYVVWKHECARLVLYTDGRILCILFRTSPFSHFLYLGALAIIPCQSTQETAFLPSTIGSYQIRFFFNYRCFWCKWYMDHTLIGMLYSTDHNVLYSAKPNCIFKSVLKVLSIIQYISNKLIGIFSKSSCPHALRNFINCR